MTTTTKCGEVYRNDHGAFEYLCNMCPMRTSLPSQFELHVSVHFQIEFVSPPEAHNATVVVKEEPQGLKTKYDNGSAGTKLTIKKEHSYPAALPGDPTTETTSKEMTDKPTFYRSCLFCGKVYSRANSLLTHLRRVHQYTPPAPMSSIADDSVRIMECDICGATFDGPYARGLLIYHLRAHVSAKRGRRRLAPQICKICEKQCISRRSLRDHILTHTNERPYRCDVCQKGFNAETTMKNHKAMHSTQQHRTPQAVCAECGLAFAAEYQLMKHIHRKHTKPTTYTCELCAPPHHLFVGYSSFAYHKESVHGREQFECDVCQKMFKIKKKMIEHRQVHSGGRPYLCRYCGNGFSQNQGKRAHERRMHEGNILVRKRVRRR